MRHEPWSSADHLARGERVLRLEGMAQDLAAEPGQIEERAQSEDQQERAEARAAAHAAHPGGTASLARST